MLVYLSHCLDVQVFVAPPGVGLLYQDSYLEFDDWFFMQCTNCVSFSPGLLAIAKVLSKDLLWTVSFAHPNMFLKTVARSIMPLRV